MTAHDQDPNFGSLRGESPQRSGPAAFAGVDRIYFMFSQAVRNFDDHTIKAVFAEDALYLTAEGETLTDAEKIRQWFAEQFELARGLDVEPRVSFVLDERGVQNDVVYDVGSYTLSWRGGAAELPIKVGRFVAVFRRVPGAFGTYRIDTVSNLPQLRLIPSRHPLN